MVEGVAVVMSVIKTFRVFDLFIDISGLVSVADFNARTAELDAKIAKTDSQAQDNKEEIEKLKK